MNEHSIITIVCENCGKSFEAELRCGDRTCEKCRRRDYYRLREKYSEIIGDEQNLKFVTLTLKNVEEINREYVQKIRDSFTKLRNRKYYKNRFKGGLYMIELKHTSSGWNLHLHALIKTNYIPQKKLSKDWENITGDSPIVDIRKFSSSEKALKYLLKYVWKSPELDGLEHVYNDIFYNTRIVQSFGCYFGRENPAKQEFSCPRCGACVWVSEFQLPADLWRKPEGDGITRFDGN